MPRLENWSLVRDDRNGFKAPELRPVVLKGNVYNHKDFEDGELISTSTVKKIEIRNRVARTMNTV
jgi:hypothetical protein